MQFDQWLKHAQLKSTMAIASHTKYYRLRFIHCSASNSIKFR